MMKEAQGDVPGGLQLSQPGLRSNRYAAGPERRHCWRDEAKSPLQNWKGFLSSVT